MQVIAISRSTSVKGQCLLCAEQYKTNGRGSPGIPNFGVKSRIINEEDIDEEGGVDENTIKHAEKCPLPYPFLVFMLEIFPNIKRLKKKINKGHEIEQISICEACMTTIVYDLLNTDLKTTKEFVEKKIPITDRPNQSYAYQFVYQCRQPRQNKSSRNC